jgi:succinyl-CoA synthetase beta subunit
MMVHEFQAKRLLASFGIPVPRGEVVEAPGEISPAVLKLSRHMVLKAQIHAGGRGKAGGIRVVSGPDEAVRVGSAMLGSRLVTPQTGPEGKIVRRLLIEEACPVERECYLGITVDRSKGAVVILASPNGGLDIESLASKRPEAVHKEDIDVREGFPPASAERLAFALGLQGESGRRAKDIAANLCRAFIALDASLIEINPLAVSAGGNIIALDVKLTLDDNALPRHPDLAALRDIAEESGPEVEAERSGLSYIKLDGNIGCLVNGAGLAMATMDLVAFYGGRPANFLDIGGGITETGVARAFSILLADPDVKAVLVNIFGGIVRCDLVARGILQAVGETGLSVPAVLRLEGTNAEMGGKILEDSGYGFQRAIDMNDAARQVVALAPRPGTVIP